MGPERTRALHEAVSELLTRLRTDEEGARDALPELEALHDELEALLEDEAATPPTLGERLRAALERFEAEHPRGTFLVGRIADALSEMGL